MDNNYHLLMASFHMDGDALIWFQDCEETEGKSGFVSHTTLIAEATFMDLFHS